MVEVELIDCLRLTYIGSFKIANYYLYNIYMKICDDNNDDCDKSLLKSVKVLYFFVALNTEL